MPFCEKCSGHYITSHTCPPLWEARVYETKWENDWTEVYGVNEEDAAEKFAEQYDCGGDYDIVKRGGEEIEVRKLGEDKIVIVDVHAETVPQYQGAIREPR